MFEALKERHRLQQEREDWRFGMLAATLANSSRRKGRPYKPQDFMPQTQVHKQVQPWQQQLAIVAQLNSAFGGQDMRKGAPS